MFRLKFFLCMIDNGHSSALGFVNRQIRLIYISMESKLFDGVRYNTNHVLHQLLPPEKDITIICDNDLIPLLFHQKTTILSGRIFFIRC